MSIVTDAGFKTPWFQQVESLGWYYVGRVRGRIKCNITGSEDWCDIKDLFPKSATSKAKYLGNGKLGKTTKTQISCHFISYKKA